MTSGIPINLDLGAEDLNGDGHEDLVVTESGPPADGLPFSYGNALLVYLGAGDGTFQPPVSFATAVGPQGVAIGDVNGDRRPDLLAAVGSLGVSILLGTGDGTFLPQTDSVTSVGSGMAVSADFNDDGNADIAVVGGDDQVTDVATVRLGNRDGTFGSPASFLTGPSPDRLISGDFNGGGILDLAVTFTGGAGVSILQGNGDGTFGSPVNTALESYVQGFTSGYFNSDNKLDLAIFGPAFQRVYILLGTGSETFNITTIEPFSFGNGLGVISLVATDVNADGKVDLVASFSPAQFQGASLAVCLGNGDGTFQAPFLTGSGGVGGTLVARDMNGDSKIDMVEASGSALILLGNGDGTFQGPPVFGFRVGTPLSGLPAVGDVNSDGKPDVVVGSTILLGTGDGKLLTYGPLLVSPVPLFVSTPISPVLADFNKDGGLDLAVSTAFSGISVLRNRPSVAIHPESLEFGLVPVGEASEAQSVKVSNPGSMPLAIQSVAAAGDFDAANACPSSLAIASTCNIGVSFSPTSAGQQGGSLTISDAAPTVVQIVQLSGTGTAPTADLSVNSLDFGTQMPGSTSTDQPVLLTNNGQAPLLIASIATSGAFVITTEDCGSGLPVGTNCTINVAFAPTEAGSLQGTLTISDNAPGTPHTVSLTGTGSDFSVAAASGSSISATVSAGQSATYALEFSPTGGFSGTINLTCSGAPSKSNCTVSPNSVSLNGVDSGIATVTVTTTASAFAMPNNWIGFQDDIPNTHPLHFLVIAAMVILGAAVLGVQGRRTFGHPFAPSLGSRPHPVVAGSLMLILSMALGWTACGGGNTPPPVTGTPQGTYTLTITATFTSGTGTVTHNIPLTLKVK